MSEYRCLTAERRRNAWFVTLETERIVDDPRTDDLRREVAAFIKDADPPNVVVDLSRVALISSAGVAFFQHLSRAIAARHGYAAFCGAQPDVRNLFRMMGLDTFFTVFDDAAAAVAAFD